MLKSASRAKDAARRFSAEVGTADVVAWRVAEVVQLRSEEEVAGGVADGESRDELHQQRVRTSRAALVRPVLRAGPVPFLEYVRMAADRAPAEDPVGKDE